MSIEASRTTHNIIPLIQSDTATNEAMHMEPWQSWTVVGIVGIGAYLYYSRSSRNQRGQIRSLPFLSQTSQHQAYPAQDGGKSRKKKSKSSTQHDHSDSAETRSRSVTASGNVKANRKEIKSVSKSSPQISHAKDQPSQRPRRHSPMKQVGNEAGLDNQEFAKQMAGVRTGASLVKNTEKPVKLQKQDKQAHLSTPVPSMDMSRTSSTTGVDADDDATPATSPDVSAAKPAGDISDMLEAPGKGPSVIRLTDLPKEQISKVLKPKVEQPVETKKQRQRRRQKEELQELRKESEKERRIKLENQLRTARIAEGRPAKDGSASRQSSVPSVWTKSANGNTISAPSENVALLDTFESTGIQPQKALPESDSASTSEKAWEQEHRSEEEQMRLINEIDGDGWSTVEKGGKSKKKKANGQTDSSGPGSVAATDEGPRSAAGNVNEDLYFQHTSPSAADGTQKKVAVKGPIDPKVWNRANIHDHPDYNPEHPWALTGHPEDSDWSVV